MTLSKKEDVPGHTLFFNHSKIKNYEAGQLDGGLTKLVASQLLKQSFKTNCANVLLREGTAGGVPIHAVGTNPSTGVRVLGVILYCVPKVVNTLSSDNVPITLAIFA